MSEPRILGRAVPMLDLRMDTHNSFRLQGLGRLALLLVPTVTGNADQHLATLVVDVPVVAATRLEGDVCGTELIVSQRCEVALTDKVLCEGVTRLVSRKDRRRVFLSCGIIVVLSVPYLLSEVEDRPALRPAGLHRSVGDDCDDLLTGHTVFLCGLQMIE